MPSLLGQSPHSGVAVGFIGESDRRLAQKPWVLQLRDADRSNDCGPLRKFKSGGEQQTSGRSCEKARARIYRESYVKYDEVWATELKGNGT